LDKEFEVIEKEGIPKRWAVVTEDYSMMTNSIKVKESSIFAVRDIIKDAITNEIMEVTAIIPGEIFVLRAQKGSDYKMGYKQNPLLIIIRNPLKEWVYG
jgi:hypothetical protein